MVIVETHAQPCHPISQLPNQEDGCFTFRTIPELTEDFAIPVLVGVCTDLELPNLPLLRLFESQGPNDNTPVVLLPEEPTPDFLVDDCLNFGMASTGSSWLGDFARAGWQHVGRPMASLFAPEPLHAATFLAKSGSLGGRTKNFSNIGWAEGGELEYGAEGYRYLELSGGASPPSGFETPGFDDSSWAVGDAPFWDSPDFDGCPAITPAAGVGTTWNLSTHILLRRPFFLPDGATNVKVGIAIDNDVQVWVNGVEVSSGIQQHENCATEDSFVFSVGLGDVTVPGVNVLVVRGIDRAVMSYVDAEVTFDIGN